MSDSAAAIRRAQSLAASNADAIAFARTGDPSCGEFDEAEILQCFGTVPAKEALMGYE